MKYSFFMSLCIFVFISSCQENKKDNGEVMRLVMEWQGKEIIFPKNIIFTRNIVDTLDWQLPESDFKVLIYVDSLDCINCNLQLTKWKEWIASMDSIVGDKVSFLFFLQSKDLKEIGYILRRDKFEYPICIDTNDELNKENHFSSNISFQTFLLDKENRVIVIGNPIHNPAIKDLYFKQITGKETSSAKLIKTTVKTDIKEVNLGSFPRSATRRATFTLSNTGERPLVIINIATTCGCANVSFNKEPTQPGNSIQIYVDITPKNIGFFDETITVHCNTLQQIKLKIKGQAE